MGTEKTRQEAQPRSRSQNLQQHLPSEVMLHAPERARHSGGQLGGSAPRRDCWSCFVPAAGRSQKGSSDLEEGRGEVWAFFRQRQSPLLSCRSWKAACWWLPLPRVSLTSLINGEDFTP